SPNSVWVSDITEFHVAGQKLYLSPIMDLHDRMILAHTIAKAPTTTMTAQTLTMAIKEHQPAPGLMVHTDQGLHYQHSSWRDLITQAGAEQSMSRKGNCFDNAVMENFFGQLKTEMYYNQKFSSFEQLEQAIDSYITWYNTQRLQTQFKGQTPTEKRHQALQPQPK
ncbi:IS3 family transposase, partial [Brevibacterium ravenspurgense]|uniref:IS3 family transposase n=1 Tax=Brevibacterium ravenspurgense TaxID=479117 RepID=UPI00036E946B